MVLLRVSLFTWKKCRNVAATLRAFFSDRWVKNCRVPSRVMGCATRAAGSARSPGVRVQRTCCVRFPIVDASLGTMLVTFVWDYFLKKQEASWPYMLGWRIIVDREQGYSPVNVKQRKKRWATPGESWQISQSFHSKWRNLPWKKKNFVLTFLYQDICQNLSLMTWHSWLNITKWMLVKHIILPYISRRDRVYLLLMIPLFNRSERLDPILVSFHTVKSAPSSNPFGCFFEIQISPTVSKNWKLGYFHSSMLRLICLIWHELLLNSCRFISEEKRRLMVWTGPFETQDDPCLTSSFAAAQKVHGKMNTGVTGGKIYEANMKILSGVRRGHLRNIPSIPMRSKSEGLEGVWSSLGTKIEPDSATSVFISASGRTLFGVEQRTSHFSRRMKFCSWEMLWTWALETVKQKTLVLQLEIQTAQLLHHMSRHISECFSNWAEEIPISGTNTPDTDFQCHTIWHQRTANLWEQPQSLWHVVCWQSWFKICTELSEPDKMTVFSCAAGQCLPVGFC